MPRVSIQMSSFIPCPIRAVFDIETKSIGNPYEIEASSIVIITTDQPDRMLRFTADEIREGVEFLLACPGYVGFNSRRFDMPVLLKSMSRGEGRLMRSKPHFDFLHEFTLVFGNRVSLANMARTTLGLEKFDLVTADPPLLYQIDPKKLLTYNAWDTYLTYLLFIFVIENGYTEFTLPTVRRFVPETISRTF